jgi:hypothetical protein
MAQSPQSTSGFWHIQEQVYFLKLVKDPSFDQFRSIFKALIEASSFLNQPFQLVVDVSEMRFTGNTWANILQVQQELYSLPLSEILVVGQSRNRLMRLMMLKLFDPKPASVKFLDSLDDAYPRASAI